MPVSSRLSRVTQVISTRNCLGIFLLSVTWRTPHYIRLSISNHPSNKFFQDSDPSGLYFFGYGTVPFLASMSLCMIGCNIQHKFPRSAMWFAASHTKPKKAFQTKLVFREPDTGYDPDWVSSARHCSPIAFQLYQIWSRRSKRGLRRNLH